MILTESLLPPAFADLERFAVRWAMATTTDERYAIRGLASFEELRALYAALTPRIEAVFEHLDKIPYDEDLPPAEQRLYQLALAGAEASAAVEIFNQPDVPFRTQGHVVRARWTEEA